MPTVLTHEEAIAVLSKLSGTHQLVAQILYGSGLSLSEALSLRVKVSILLSPRLSCAIARAATIGSRCSP
ncbi:MAG: hypothetical protein MH252_21375 [Thermosynechococcaceae cyanobacterium MS004]|nr:hypothetical protein [Thermosynechococcaceae cyanobacterium MS004]